MVTRCDDSTRGKERFPIEGWLTEGRKVKVHRISLSKKTREPNLFVRAQHVPDLGYIHVVVAMHSVYHLQVRFAILEKRPSAESRDLDGFETWLRQSRLSEPTIQEHVDNMRLFLRYLLLYADSLYTTSIGIKIPPS
jgi:hypothetical protein